MRLRPYSRLRQITVAERIITPPEKTDLLKLTALVEFWEAIGANVEIMDAARREALVHTTLALGDVAKIDGEAFSLIGLMRCREVGETDEWTEYLLFDETAGFVWLVESGAGWDKVKVLDAWPESVSASAVSLEGSAFTRMQAYGAEVIHAAGAFNWRVQVGDTVSITDYRGARGTLSSERSPAEISWSLAQRVPAGTVDGWFGKKGKLAAAVAAGSTAVQADSVPAGALHPLALRFTAEQVVDFLGQWGPCLVDAGGDLTAGDGPAGHPGWPVAIAMPLPGAGRPGMAMDVPSPWIMR